MTNPQNYHKLTECAKRASCLSWDRQNKSLTLWFDDKPSDRRTVLRANLTVDSVEMKTLCGYDAVKNEWRGGYIQPCGNVRFENKRGLKALLAYIRELAIAQCDYAPNPVMLFIYR